MRRRLMLVTTVILLAAIAVVGATRPREAVARTQTFTATIGGPDEVEVNEACLFWTNPTGGTPPYTYSWNAGGTMSSSSGVTHTATSVGSYSVTLSVWDANNQLATDSKTVQVKADTPDPCPY